MITGTVWYCKCGRAHRKPVVPIDIANHYKLKMEELSDYLKEAAGERTVLLPVDTLNAIADRAERAELELEALRAKLDD